jgi:hypothetical protein
MGKKKNELGEIYAIEIALTSSSKEVSIGDRRPLIETGVDP